MKKILSVLFILLIVLGLCGCGGGDAGSAEPSVSGETVSDNSNIAADEVHTVSYDFSVSLTLPAPFTLYLTNDMVLAAVEPGDGDAEAIFSGLDLAGLTYDEGMGLLLNSAFSQGFLVNQGKVNFTVDCEIFTAQLMMDLFAPVMQFEKDNAVFIFIGSNVAKPEEPDYDPNYLYALQKIKGEQETIYMEKANWIHPVSGEQTVYSFFSEFPDPSIYNLGSLMIGDNLDQIRIKMLSFNADGTWSVTYFKDEHVYKAMDFSETNFYFRKYENGQTIDSVEQYSNENSWVYEYDNGENKKQISFYTDETWISQSKFTFHSNGNTATDEQIYWDGGFNASTRTYDENETILSSSLYSPNGSYTETKYENGEAVYEKTIFADGTYQEGTYENGTLTYSFGTVETTTPES